VDDLRTAQDVAAAGVPGGLGAVAPFVPSRDHRTGPRPFVPSLSTCHPHLVPKLSHRLKVPAAPGP
jgi:hypothetical protein